jgi:MFS family permease
MLVHISLILNPDCDGCYWGAISLVFLGLAVAINGAALLPSIPFTVQPKAVGTAFGIAIAGQNISFGVGPLITGALIDGTSQQDGFFWVIPTQASIFFITMDCLAIAVAILLNIVDSRNGGVLNSKAPKM